MPVFEYRCNDCDTKYEILHKSREIKENIVCPKCNSQNSKKLLSGFSASVAYTPSSPCAAAGACDKVYGGCSGGACGLD